MPAAVACAGCGTPLCPSCEQAPWETLQKCGPCLLPSPRQPVAKARYALCAVTLPAAVAGILATIVIVGRVAKASGLAPLDPDRAKGIAAALLLLAVAGLCGLPWIIAAAMTLFEKNPRWPIGLGIGLANAAVAARLLAPAGEVAQSARVLMILSLTLALAVVSFALLSHRLNPVGPDD